MTDDELAAIEALCAAHPDTVASYAVNEFAGHGEYIYVLLGGNDLDTVLTQEETEAVARKVNALPALLAAYRALAAERDAMLGVTAAAREYARKHPGERQDDWYAIRAALEALEAP